jgi:predicted O-methyltransferase YrrM
VERSEFYEVIGNIESDGGLGMRLPGGACRMLYGIARTLTPEVYVDIGTFVGLSSLWVARAMEENGCGRVYTVEIDNHWLDMAKINAVNANLDHRIEFIHGDSKEVLRDYDFPATIDFALIDNGNKDLYVTDFENIEPKLSEKAIIVAHDIVHPSEVSYDPAWEFKGYIDTRYEYESFLVHGDLGVLLIQRR